MIEELGLKGGEKVLEIGAGTGYVAAVLVSIADQVFIIERVDQHAETAASNLIDIGCRNFHLRHDDGTQGWIEEAPFDAILVSGGAPFVPEVLKNQLAPGGRMVVPVGFDPRAQELVRVTRHDKGEFVQEDLADLRFVPLIGNQGWTTAILRARPWAQSQHSCQSSAGSNSRCDNLFAPVGPAAPDCSSHTACSSRRPRSRHFTPAKKSIIWDNQAVDQTRGSLHVEFRRDHD